MKSEISILINSGIELLTEGRKTFSINGEIETRRNTGRKLNRSIEHAEGTPNYCGEVFELPLDVLLHMKKENDYFIQKLYDLKKENSPYKNIVPVVLDRFETGAIVYDSWGYDQTNIDFYCIVKRSGQMVTLLPMKKKVSAEIGFMTNDNIPTEIDLTGEPISKKIRVTEGKESGFSLRNYSGGGWVSLYEGQPKRSTSYA